MAKDSEANGSLIIRRKAENGIDLWIGGEQREDTIQSVFRMSGRERYMTPGDLTLFQCCITIALNNGTYAA